VEPTARFGGMLFPAQRVPGSKSQRLSQSAGICRRPGSVEAVQGGMKKVLALSHAEIQRRIEEERKRSAANPNRRGPKPKANGRRSS
jgi:hypothetical protein